MPFSELYKQLSEAIIQKKVRKDRSLADLEKLLRGCINYSPACRSIASVLGPNYCKADLDCINSGDAVVRLNKNPSLNLEIEETNGRCDVVYFNREFPFILCQNGENVDSGNIKFRFRIEDSDLSQCLGANNHENFQYYDRPNRLFPNGNANMGPAAVYDLVLRGYYVKIIGMDFFTSSNLYSRSHYSATKEESLMNMLARNHDVLSNFSFLKALLREGVVSAVGNTSILNDLTLEQYAQNVQGRFGFFDFS